MKKGPINKKDVQRATFIEGIHRKTITYNSSVMLCQFILEKDAEIPLHDHEANQTGYVLFGRIKFLTETRGEFIVQEGDGYTFDAWEKHGAKIIETAEIIEVFNPIREDFK